MKVLRERLLPHEVYNLDERQDPPEVMGPQLCGWDGVGHRSKQTKMATTDDCLSKKTETVVCNGNGIVGLHKQNTLLKMRLKPFVHYTLHFRSLS